MLRADRFALAQGYQAEFDAVMARLPRVTRIVSSPLLRCRQLAAHIGDHVKLEVGAVERWIEMDFGRWEGVPWAQVPRTELDAWAADFMGL